jgi:hypothetical protein
MVLGNIPNIDSPARRWLMLEEEMNKMAVIDMNRRNDTRVNLSWVHKGEKKSPPRKPRRVVRNAAVVAIRLTSLDAHGCGSASDFHRLPQSRPL